MSHLNGQLLHSIHSLVVLHSAMILMHKFILSNQPFFLNFQPDEKIFAAAGAYFLSTKINNCFIFVKSLANTVQFLLNKKYNNGKYSQQDSLEYIKQKILDYETEILMCTNFDVNLDTPVPFLFRLKEFTEPNSQKKFELLCSAINDSYTLPLCLYYNPNTIVVSCAKLLQEKFHITMDMDKFISMSEFQINIEEVQRCQSILNILFKGISSSIQTNTGSFPATNKPINVQPSHTQKLSS